MTSRMQGVERRERWGFAAIVSAALFAWLGFSVTRYGEPAAFAGVERALVNHSTLVAWWITWSCYIQVLVPLCVVLLLIAWRFPEWRARILFSIVVLLLCWRGVDLLQHVFARPRRLDWVVKHETTYSYPSSHAAIATGFYALWAVMLATSELSRRTRVIEAGLLILLALAICWSRLALGAHYLTDLAGGALFAIAIVSAAAAVVPFNVFSPPAGRPYPPAE
jgi:membrane-associated phospholipid phosphatase